MAVQHETGHAKNVANLQKLIEQVTTYTAYNPSVDNLKIEVLNVLYQNALASLDNMKTKINANKNAIYIRQDLYVELKPKTTRVVNHLDILNLKEGTFAQVKSLNNLIQGKKITKASKTDEVSETLQILEQNIDILASDKTKEKEEEREKKTISTSRQSYTQIAENLSKLVQLVETIETYNPNVEDLKLVKLQEYHTNLVNATQQVNQTEAELNTELIQRNKILYNQEIGLYTTAQNVKKYVKSVYGANSLEYTKVSKIKFKDKQ